MAGPDMSCSEIPLYTVDCGRPDFPFSGGDVSTEGATVSFRCEDGLLPTQPNTTCTEVGTTGQWIPSPDDVQCCKGS